MLVYFDFVKKKEIKLTKFRDIKISDFKLPNDFKKWKKKEKHKFIFNNKNRFIINISVNEKHLVYLINKYRKENNIGELVYDEIISFEELIIDNFSEPILFKKENIFKLSNINYLFKYPVGEFIKKFKEKNTDIINILLKDNLNKIIIITKNYIEFINIFESQERKRSLDDYKHFLLKSEDMNLRNRRWLTYSTEYFEN